MAGSRRTLQALQSILGSAFKSRHLEDFKLESDMILFISVIVINDSFTEANKFSDNMDFPLLFLFLL